MKRPCIALGMFLGTMAAGLLALEMPYGQTSIAAAIGPNRSSSICPSVLLEDPDFAFYFAVDCDSAANADQVASRPASSSSAMGGGEAVAACSADPRPVALPADPPDVPLAAFEDHTLPALLELPPEELGNVEVNAPAPSFSFPFGFFADEFCFESLANDKVASVAVPADDAQQFDEQPIDEKEQLDEQPIDEQQFYELLMDEQQFDEWTFDDEQFDEQPVDDGPLDEQPFDGEQFDEQPVDEESVDEESVDEESVDQATSADDFADCFPTDFYYGCVPYVGGTNDRPADDLSRHAPTRSVTPVDAAVSSKTASKPVADARSSTSSMSFEVEPPFPWDDFAALVGCPTVEGRCALLDEAPQVGLVADLVEDRRHSTGLADALIINQSNEGLAGPESIDRQRTQAIEIARRQQVVQQREAVGRAIRPLAETAAQLLGEIATSLNDVARALNKLAGAATIDRAERTAATASPSGAIGH